LEHIESCRECGARFESMQELRSQMRGMNQAPVPADLTARLRVLASHERPLQLQRISLRARWDVWRDGVRLWFDNLMRPVALPFAGGFLAAAALFAVLVSTLNFDHGIFDRAFFTYPDGEVAALDATGAFIPAKYGHPPWIVRTDAITPDDANVVWLTIDENGKVSDYSVERGQLTPELQSLIMFSQFTPATVLGLPTSSKVKAVQFIPRSGLPTRSLRS